MCLHLSSCSLSIHLFISIMLHPSIPSTLKWNTSSMCQSAPRLPLWRLLSLFVSSCLCLFVSCVAFSCIKSSSFLFQCVSLSVCLCPCGHLLGCLAAGGKWGHSQGDPIRRTLRGETFPLAPKGPNRRGLVPLSFFPSHSFCPCVSLCAINRLFALLWRRDPWGWRSLPFLPALCFITRPTKKSFCSLLSNHCSLSLSLCMQESMSASNLTAYQTIPPSITRTLS